MYHPVPRHVSQHMCSTIARTLPSSRSPLLPCTGHPETQREPPSNHPLSPHLRTSLASFRTRSHSIALATSALADQLRIMLTLSATGGRSVGPAESKSTCPRSAVESIPSPTPTSFNAHRPPSHVSVALHLTTPIVPQMECFIGRESGAIAECTSHKRYQRL